MTSSGSKRRHGRWVSGCAVAAVLVLGAAPALASDNVYDPSSYAYAADFGSPYASVVQTEIRNGVVGNTYDQTSGSARSTSASPDGYFNGAEVVTNTGNTAFAKADLHHGTVKGFAQNGLGTLPSRGFAQSRIQDTVFFNNASGGIAYLPFSFSFDGSIAGDPNITGASALAIFSIAGGLSACSDGSYGTCPGDHSLRLQNGGTVNQTTQIGYMGNGSQNGVQQGGAFFFGAADNVDLTNYSVLKQSGPGGYHNTVVSSVLALPEGRSRIGFDLRLIIDCWVVPGVRCDFGDTTAFDFGRVPDGLTFTSASGVFLTGDGTVGGVPEPGSWALFIAGFGMAGVRLRRRRPLVVTA